MVQIVEIVHHPRDKDGELVRPDDGSGNHDEYIEEWRGRGLSDAEIELKYDEDLHIQCYREQLQRERTTNIEAKVIEFRKKILAARTWSR